MGEMQRAYYTSEFKEVAVRQEVEHRGSNSVRVS